MNAALWRFAVLVAGLLLLCPESANSQARGQPTSAQRNRVRQAEVSTDVRTSKLAELEQWLDRLPGRFRVEGNVELDAGYICEGTCREVPGTRRDGSRYIFVRSPQGIAECARIGTGSGVSCEINVSWQTEYFFTGALGIASRAWPEAGTLAPAKFLIGIDPAKLEISYLQVDDQSLALLMQGALVSNRVSFRTPCMNGPGPRGPNCRRSFWIRALPDGKSFELGLNIVMWGVNWAGYRFRLIRQLEEPG